MGTMESGPGGQRARPTTTHFALAFAASHSALVISRYPLPLQEFWPLQALLALLHAECPLQELTPSHFIFPSAALAVLTGTAENITAAAAARATLDRILEFIRRSPKRMGGGADCSAGARIVASSRGAEVSASTYTQFHPDASATRPYSRPGNVTRDCSLAGPGPGAILTRGFKRRERSDPPAPGYITICEARACLPQVRTPHHTRQ